MTAISAAQWRQIHQTLHEMVVDRGYTVTTSVAADEMEQKILARDPLITGQAENSSPGAPPFVVQVITAPENKIGVLSLIHI